MDSARTRWTRKRCCIFSRTKGRIEPGADADLCLFDPSALRERDSYEHPETLATGMDYVLVGGRPAIAEARFTF